MARKAKSKKKSKATKKAKPAARKHGSKKASKKARRSASSSAKASRSSKTSKRAKPAEPERLPVPKTYKLWVNGAFIRSESGRYEPITDGKGRLVANLARASRKDFRDAVVAARKAQGGWAARSAFNRSQILYRVAEMIEHRRPTFERSLIDEAGRTEATAAADVSTAIDRMFWYAGWCDKFAQVLGGVNPVASSFFNFTIPEAVGVVTIFAPTRSPLLGLVSAVAPVILSGNTAVVVVEGEAPQLAIDLAEALATSDLPAGVVNILTGPRDELVPHAASHMDVNAIAFHCAKSDEDGPLLASLQQEAAHNVKRVRVDEDRTADAWRRPDAQSLYSIQDFIEWKTAWHPIGV